MTKVESYILKKRIISANRRRKRAEKTLKRVRKSSTASINHWKRSAESWQKIAREFAMKYHVTLDVSKNKDLEEAIRIQGLFFTYNMARNMTAGTSADCTNQQTMYDGFFSACKDKEAK